METNLKILPRVEDRISFLYLEYCKIEREDFAIVVINESSKVLVPIADVNILMLGPGTSITHGAINIISSSGCSVVWCGSGMTRFYSYHATNVRSSENLLKQIEMFTDDDKHLFVVRKMYKKRFKNVPVDNSSLKELRGIEGSQMKATYKYYAKKYGVKWYARNSHITSFEEQDLINKILTLLNQNLYAICHAIILALGFSPAIGFIHTGKMESFVYDVSDFYKEEIIIPLAFSLHNTINENYLESECRKAMRKTIIEKKLISKITKDLISLFKTEIEDPDVSVNELWDLDGYVPGNTNYGRD